MLLAMLIHTIVQLSVTSQQNLTPFGIATQSTVFGGSLSNPNNAILPPISNDFDLNICSHTEAGSDPSADWWMFQFSFESAYITDITIYYRTDFAYRMDGFKLFVTNTSAIPPNGYLCYEDSDPGLPNITQNIPCYKSGKYVIYYDTTGDEFVGPVVELCYVAINGCPKGMWGPNCTKPCSSICIGKHCYPGNGSCIWGCDPQRCVNGRCDIHTGTCIDGCVTGWVGQYCMCGTCNMCK